MADRFEGTSSKKTRFGEITRAPDGQYLLSIFQEYIYRGTKVEDFTIPFDAAAWFELSVTLSKFSDAQLVDAVLYEPYKRAWQERVGPLPTNLGAELRRLIAAYLSSHKESSDDARSSTSVRAALMLMKAECERMNEQARELNIALFNRNFGNYAHLRFRPSLLETALEKAIEALAEDKFLLGQLSALRSAAAAADVELDRLVREGGDARQLQQLVLQVLNSSKLVADAVDRAIKRLPS